MGRLIMDTEDLRRHLIKMVEEGGTEKLGEYYTNVCIKKYTHVEQDLNFQEVCRTILEVPGGYWQIVDNMHYLPEFEHYGMKSMLSYEKKNVPKTVAKKELDAKTYQKLYK